jgi:hypothetical protein
MLLHVQPAAVEAAAASAEAVAAADSVQEAAAAGVAANPVHDDFDADNAAAISKLQPTSEAELQKARQRRQTQTQPSSLLAVVTANVWNKTELLLQSLTGNRDAFEVLVSRLSLFSLHNNGVVHTHRCAACRCASQTLSRIARSSGVVTGAARVTAAGVDATHCRGFDNPCCARAAATMLSHHLFRRMQIDGFPSLACQLLTRGPHTCRWWTS